LTQWPEIQTNYFRGFPQDLDQSWSIVGNG